MYKAHLCYLYPDPQFTKAQQAMQNINASLCCHYVLYSPDPLLVCVCLCYSVVLNSIYSFVMLVTVCPINFISAEFHEGLSAATVQKLSYQI